MLGLLIVDMQKWMFRYPERAAQIPLLVSNINMLAETFVESELPIFDVRTIHKADRSTWSRLMRKYDYACLLEGTDDADFVDGYRSPERAVQITKTASSAFVGTDFERVLKAAGVAKLVLTGVFIDGCVGITAADAAQRGLEVTLGGCDRPCPTRPPGNNPQLADRRLRDGSADNRTDDRSPARSTMSERSLVEPLPNSV